MQISAQVIGDEASLRAEVEKFFKLCYAQQDSQNLVFELSSEIEKCN